jgi:membrane fusion protein, multidrug efflux system
VVEDVVVNLRKMSPAVVLAVCLVQAACGSDGEAAKPQQAGAPLGGVANGNVVAEFSVDTSTVQVPLQLPAQLYVEHDAVVVARAQGTIDSLFVELGDRVTAGQLLARLESTDQEIALANAEASYDNLTRVATRARALTKSGGSTAADSEQVEFQLRQAEIARRKARHDLDLTRVLAPFDGVVTERSVRPRRFVGVGDTLFRVTESTPLFARIRVPEASSSSIRIGDAATVIGAGGQRAGATIVHAAPVLDAASGTREVVLRLARGDRELVAGANVTVAMGRQRRRVVTVPRAAIAPEGYAVVVENGRTTLRPVTVGADVGGGRVEVLSGLSPGERLARPAR